MAGAEEIATPVFSDSPLLLNMREIMGYANLFFPTFFTD
jgi:hypothetical protein